MVAELCSRPSALVGSHAPRAWSYFRILCCKGVNGSLSQVFFRTVSDGMAVRNRGKHRTRHTRSMGAQHSLRHWPPISDLCFMFLLHGNQGISVCNLLVHCDGTGAAPRTESRTQAHDSMLVRERIHSDMRSRTPRLHEKELPKSTWDFFQVIPRNQGISVCNLLGNCDGTGAAPRSESRTQAHDSLIVVSDTLSLM